LKEAVQALQHGGGGLQQKGCPLVHHLGFPREGGFPQAQLHTLQKSGIGGDPIPGLYPDEIARHQLFAGQALPLLVAAHHHQGLGHLPQGQKGFLGTGFLQIAQ
jgi:hypothetical protein